MCLIKRNFDGHATLYAIDGSQPDMCAFLRPSDITDTSPKPRPQNETHGLPAPHVLADAEPRSFPGNLAYQGDKQAPFLSRRSRNAKGVLIGGAVLASAAAIGVAAIATTLTKRYKRVDDRRLRGKVVVVTGSSRGLGLALAEEFARRGARIVLNARDQNELERAREALVACGAVHGQDEVLLVPADLGKAEEAEYLIHRVFEHWGHIDVLVNNAGVITVGPVENLTAQDFRDVMDSNFFSGLHCTLAVLPKMLARHAGTIVNITSIGGKVAVPHLLSYTASKFAAVGFSQGLHVELKRKGVHVLTVCPGLMRTGSHVNALFSGHAEEEYRWFSLAASTPLAAAHAQSAARKIVRAVLRGTAEIAITPQAILAARLGQVSPEVTALLLGLMNGLLPEANSEDSSPRRGMDVRALELSPASHFGWSAAKRYNELG